MYLDDSYYSGIIMVAHLQQSCYVVIFTVNFSPFLIKTLSPMCVNRHTRLLAVAPIEKVHDIMPLFKIVPKMSRPFIEIKGVMSRIQFTSPDPTRPDATRTPRRVVSGGVNCA